MRAVYKQLMLYSAIFVVSIGATLFYESTVHAAPDVTDAAVASVSPPAAVAARSAPQSEASGSHVHPVAPDAGAIDVDGVAASVTPAALDYAGWPSAGVGDAVALSLPEANVETVMQVVGVRRLGTGEVVLRMAGAAGERLIATVDPDTGAAFMNLASASGRQQVSVMDGVSSVVDEAVLDARIDFSQSDQLIPGDGTPQ